MTLLFTLNQFRLSLLLCILSLGAIAQEGNLVDNGTQKSIPNDSIKRQEVEDLFEKSINQFVEKNYAKSIEIGQEAGKLAKNIKYDRMYYRISSLVGNAFIELGDTLQAKRIFKETLDAASINTDTSAIISSVIDLGNIYTLEKDFPQATKFYQRALPIAKKFKDSSKLYILNYNLAELYLNEKKAKEARKYVTEMLRYNRNLNSPYYPAGTNLLLGRLALIENDPRIASSYLARSIEIAEPIKFVDALTQAYNYQAEAERLLGNFEKAYTIKLKEQELQLAEYDQDKIEAQESFAAKFKLAQYQQDLERQELENIAKEEKAKRDATIFWGKIAGAILLAFVAFFIFAYVRRRKLLKTLLLKNKQYLEAKNNSERMAESTRRLFSSVSHELRTPMYGIAGISSMLYEQPETQKFKDELGALKYSTDYLSTLINNVLQLNSLRGETKNILRSDKFDIRKVATNVVSNLNYVNSTKGFDIDLKISEDVPRFLIGDQVKLSQVLINILGNSKKFTNSGFIKLRVEALNISETIADIQFTVVDSGIGIDPELLPNIWDEFGEASNTNKYHGSGLGLPIVKKILDLHKSEIFLRSEKNKGTEIRFTIAFEYAEEDTPENSHHNTDNLKRIKGKTILIVDDNKINLLVTQKKLKSYGIDTELANGGMESVSKVREQCYDLVLMDIHMPEVDGFKATALIKEIRPNIPIVAFTAVNFEAIEMKIQSSSFDDILLKPYSNDKLESILFKYIT